MRKTSEAAYVEEKPRSPKSGTKIVLNLFGTDPADGSADDDKGNTSSALNESSVKDFKSP